MIYEAEGVYIKAAEIVIGDGVSFGRDVDIRCVDRFEIGPRSHLGDSVRIRGRSVTIGMDLYHSRGLDIGGGGCDRPRSILVIGDRCTIHDNHINIAEPVTIGDDVGLSPQVTLYTHGFWLSVLRGFPAKFASIEIGLGTIVGYRSTLLPCRIGNNVVIGAHSLVTGTLISNSVYAGQPAKFLRRIEEPDQDRKVLLLRDIIDEYREIAAYHGIEPQIIVNYPHVVVNGATFNVERLTVVGQEDEETDDFRDAMRRYGLRFYTDRPFRSTMKW